MLLFIVSHRRCKECALHRFQSESSSVFQSISVSSMTFIESTLDPPRLARGIARQQRETHLCTRIYASRGLHLGLWPSFFTVLLSVSVLGATYSNRHTRQRRRRAPSIPLNSTLLSATGAAHAFTDFAPEYIIINVLPLLYSHFCDNLRQSLLLITRPST